MQIRFEIKIHPQQFTAGGHVKTKKYFPCTKVIRLLVIPLFILVLMETERTGI